MRPGFLRIALLLLCLTAGTAQAWVVQLHLHAAHAEAVGALVDSATPDESGDDDNGCLLCQIVSQGGAAALAPAPARVDFSAQPGRDHVPPLPAAPRPEPPSHHWLSRGPPRG